MDEKTKRYDDDELQITDPVLGANVVGLSIVEPSEVNLDEKSRRVRVPRSRF